MREGVVHDGEARGAVHELPGARNGVEAVQRLILARPTHGPEQKGAVVACACVCVCVCACVCVGVWMDVEGTCGKRWC